MISKHAKASTKYPQGGIIKMEGPVHISNLMLIEPGTGKPTRTGRKADANGKMVRFSKKSGEVIK
jgi:large subunit ribosomal protein L24